MNGKERLAKQVKRLEMISAENPCRLPDLIMGKLADAMMKAKRDAEIQSMRTEMENMRRIIDELKHTSVESSQQANKHEYDNKNAQRI